MRRHEGSDGWRVAHERLVIRGWAGDVRGATALREAGRVSWSGKSVGEMYAGQCSLAMRERLSVTSQGEGQWMELGKFDGLG